MKNYDKLMLSLDLSELDDLLIPYAYQMAKYLGTKTLYGGHIIPVILIPNLLKLDPANYFLPTSPAVEKIRASVFEEIKAVAGQSDLKIEVRIEEGRPFAKLTAMVKDTKADLLVFGKKKNSTASGITARRVAHQVDTDILLIPSAAKLGINKILLPIDFSENSFRALQFIQDFQKKMGLPNTVHGLHVIDVSVLRQYEVDTIKEDLHQLLPQKAEKQYEDFLRHYEIDDTVLQMHFMTTESENIASTLLAYAENKDFDFVVVGAKGHSLFDNFMFGSVTETLLDISTKIPVMVIR